LVNSCGGISNEALAKFSENLQRLTGLKRLIHNFEGERQLTDEGFLSFSEALKRLCSLQEIKLNFVA